jgi:hypothetical protein
LPAVERCPLLSADVIGSLFIRNMRNRFAGRKTHVATHG